MLICNAVLLCNSHSHADIMYIQYGIITIKKTRGAPGTLTYDRVYSCQMNKISSRRVPREPSSFFPLARFVNGSVPCVFLVEAGEKCVESLEVDRLHDPSVEA